MRIAAMKMMTSAAAAFVLLASPLCASPTAAASALDVRDGWVSATVPGQSVAAAYMTLRSATAVRLVTVITNVSDAAQIHAMSLENGVMRMRHLETLAIPTGQAVTLAPGAAHLMLTGVKRPLKPGDIVQLEFTTVDGTGTKASTRVDLPVRKESPR